MCFSETFHFTPLTAKSPRFPKKNELAESIPIGETKVIEKGLKCYQLVTVIG
jgi:hypothetical protein